VLSALLATCVSLLMDTAPVPAPSQNAEEIAQRLQGTWRREFDTQDIKARRVLTLGAHGEFLERVSATDGEGHTTELVHRGTWLYDGTNLKRKYTSMNGKPPSRLNLPFATFQIEFISKDEFVGIDHIHGNRVRYERARDDSPS
jgi:hypothetical protein